MNHWKDIPQRKRYGKRLWLRLIAWLDGLRDGNRFGGLAK